METIRSTFKPVIAAVHGYCIGGGLTIALASDIIIASETTQFGLPFSSQGAVIGTSFLAEAVGYHKACELLFTADLFDAKEAERIGILNHVVPHEQLQVKAMEMAEKITDKPTPIVSWQKWVLNKSMGDDYKESMDYEAIACGLYHPSTFVPTLLQEPPKKKTYSEKE
jgi:enoyl-CoA hydratase/carnithine racemase